MSHNILPKWIKKLLTSGTRRSPDNRRPTMKLKIEVLEDRITPSNWLVTDASGGAGGPNDVTLPYAVNHAANGDTITFSSSLSGSTITLTSTLNVITSVTITGLGAASLAVTGGDSVQVFNIGSGATVTISGLTVQNGNAGSGGGIENQGTLTLGSDVVSGNTGGDINNVMGATLIAGDANAFTSTTNIKNNGTLNMAGYSESIGALSGSGTVTNNLHTYQIDNGAISYYFNNTLGAESSSNQAEDNWVGNVFTAAAGGTLLQSISFFDTASTLNGTTLASPSVTAALYTGAPGASLTLVPGSVNTVALNATAGTWITAPFASLQNIPAGNVFTAALLIDNVPSNVYPFTEDTSGSNANSYFDVDNPIGTVNTYNLAAPNNPTPNGDTYPGQPAGTTNASPDATLLRVNYASAPATLTVNGGGSFGGTIQDGSSPVALTAAGSSQTLILSGHDTYSGLTTINNGDTLKPGSATAFSVSSSLNDNGTFDLNGQSVSINSLNGNGSILNSGTAGGLTVNSGGSFSGTLVGGVPGWYTTLTVAGGTLNLSGNNTYGWGSLGGATIINSGATLQAGSTTAFSTHSYITDNGTLDLNGYGNSIDALSGNGTVIDSGTAATLTVVGGGTFSGGITGGNTALTVGGSSQTLILAGTNTYSGQTTVNSTDTLLVNGSEASPVSGQGTLGGTGTTGALTGVSGSIVSPGSPATSIGTLTANSANFSGGGDLTLEITGSSPSVSADLLSVTSAMTLGGSSTLTIDLNGLTSTTGAITVVSAGTLNGTFNSVSLINNPNGYQASVAYVGNTITITIVSIASAPIVTSPTATGITATSATLGGDVTSDGGARITDRGIVYALTVANPNPIINGTGTTQVHVSGTTGIFTTNVTGLSASTGYSFVAYATNALGTTYTNVATFVTPSPSAPTVASLSPSSGPTAGGTSVIIAGAGFTGATVVKFGSANATSFMVNSDTQITAIAPADVGIVDVTVTTPGGVSSTSSADQFTYVIWNQFNGNPQHSGISSVAARPTDQILWSTSDEQVGSYFEHFGEPVFTLADTVIVPVVLSGPTFELEGFDGNTATGTNPTPLWTVTSNYIQPSYSWLPPYQPVYDPTSNRVYYAGPGGTLNYISNPDSATPTVTQEAFYGESNYTANPSVYNSSIYIDTPLTVDNSGNVYFGFEETGSNPSGISDGGIGRVSSAGVGSYITVGAAVGAGSGAPALAAAPALSNDGSILYEAVADSYGSYLVEVNAANMTHMNSVNVNNIGYFTDISTASPMVGPDGTVFMGVFNDYNGSRGYMTHFSADLQTAYPVGAFGWDDTASVIPTSMVPSYTGTSTYLIATKYNYYAGLDNGNGVNKIAILDPYATMTDPNLGDSVSVVMKEVMTVTSPTEDSGNIGNYPDATREWCTNGTVVDPATDSIFINNEDGYDYRWNLGSNTLTQAVDLTQGYGEPYTPTSIGPNGVVYALNGGTLFALGGYSNYTLTNVTSQTPAVVGQPVTFSTTLASTNGGVVPAGSITYSYTSGVNTQSNSTPILLNNGNPVPLVNGQATLTTSSLPPDHYHIIATYSGDSPDGYAAGSTVLVQAILETTTTSLSSSANPSTVGQSVTFTATVNPTPGTSFYPLGTVSFMDGNTLLGTANPNYNGTTDTVTFTTSSLAGGSHLITAVFSGDLNFNGSTSNTVTQMVGEPTVISPTDTNITAMSAILGGDVTSDGGSTITDSGIVYALTSANANPTIGGTGCVQVSAGGATGVFTTNVTGLTASSGYSFVAYATNANGTTYSSVATFTTDPSITSVVINQNIPALWDPGYGFTPGVQRSMVNDIVYTFSEAVNILSPGADPSVFTVTALTINGITGQVPTLSWAPVAGSGNTEWAVTFSGNGVDGGSIADGAYDITVNHPLAITAVSDSQAVSVIAGAAPGTGNPDYATQAFFRLFGDINGNGIVNAQDNAKFKLALAAGGYNAAFDWDGNGSVNALDNAKFKHSLISGYNFLGFTPTI